MITSLLLRILGDTSDLRSELEKSHKEFSDFTKTLGEIGGLIGVAFSVDAIVEFTGEAVKLAAQAEGVRMAFEKNADSARLMESLKQATHGTVDELALMKRTVQAANFNISLGALPKLLEFATARAQQTGESVDYLVDSIVTGIGRKSPLILDNLGISAVALKEKLGGVSLAAADVGRVAEAVGQIAKESLDKTGGVAETTDVKIQQLSASWEDFKEKLGKTVVDSGIPGVMLQIAKSTIEGRNEFSHLINTIQTLNKGAFNDWVVDEKIKEAGEAAHNFGYDLIKINGQFELIEKKGAGVLPGAMDKMGKSAHTIAVVEAEIAEQKEKQKDASGADLVLTNRKIERLKLELSILENIGNTKPPPDPMKDWKPAEDNFKFDPTSLAKPLQSAVDDLPDLNIPVDIKLPDELSDEDKAQMEDLNQSIKENWNTLAQSAQAAGEAVGSTLAQVLSGQETFVQGLAGITADMIDLFGKQAVAAIAAAALADPTTGPFPWAKIAALTAATALVSGFFRALGGSGSGAGGIGGGGAPGVLPSEAASSRSPLVVAVTVEGQVKGENLDLVMRKWQYKKSRTG